MEKKKIKSLDELDKIADNELFEWDGNYQDDHGNIHNFEEDIKTADEQIDKIKKGNEDRVNFRWNKAEIERCRRIAAKKGLKYQTYIKSVLKQAMDSEDKAG